MATFKIYKLHFTSPLHIESRQGDSSVSMTTVCSDTFYAAITSCLAKRGDQVPDDGDLGFTVSSLFPYYQKDETDSPVFFLPMPLPLKRANLLDVSFAKKLKKIQWVDASIFGEMISGLNGFDTDKHVHEIQGAYLTEEELKEAADGSREFVVSEVSQRVCIKSRTGEEDAKPYFVDKILFRYHSGLYFIVEGDTSKLEAALQMLSLEGIGTDRNVGYGFFEYSVDTLSLETPTQANHQINLSLMIPESENQLRQMMDSDLVAYDFVRRGGWITTSPYNTLRKNAIYAFLPGSVFKNVMKDPAAPVGKIVNLAPNMGEMTPDHPVWRSGRSIVLPFKF